MKMLERKRACEEGKFFFKENFGESVDVSLKTIFNSKKDWRKVTHWLKWFENNFLPKVYQDRIERGYLSEIAEMEKFLLPEAIYINPLFNAYKVRTKHFVIQYNAYMDSKKKKK